MKLCNGDIDRPLRVEIFDFEKSGAHKSMGIVETSVRGLLDSRSAQINVIEADKKLKSRSYVNSGTFSVTGTHSLTHSLTLSLTHSLSHSLTHSLTNKGV